VIDASGGYEVTIRENAVARMRDHGITPINWTTSAPSCSATGSYRLARTWCGSSTITTPPPYGLLMDSFEAATKAS